MGSGGIYVCGKCGNATEELWIGAGFMSDPCNPLIGASILDGEYGEKAKKILKENPDSEFCFHKGLFQCRCGNLTSKDVVRIWTRGKKIAEGVPWRFGGPNIDMYERGKKLYHSVANCSECGKRMHELRYPPMEMPCPKCDGIMRFERTVLWD